MSAQETGRIFQEVGNVVLNSNGCRATGYEDEQRLKIKKVTARSQGLTNELTNRRTYRHVMIITIKKIKAGYTATPVACGWTGAIFELTSSFGHEQ